MHHSLRLIAALALLLPLAAQAATRVDERAPLGAGGRVEVSTSPARSVCAAGTATRSR